MRYTIILAIWIALWTFISNYQPRIEYIEVGTCSELFDDYRNSDKQNKSIEEFNRETWCSYMQEFKNKHIQNEN